MAEDPFPKTNAALLSRLRHVPSDQSGWALFVEQYGRHIYRWCREWKLQAADAEDVTQDVLLRLSRKLPEFSYDPSRRFRSWLKTVAHHVWQDFEARRRKAHATGGAEDLMPSLEAREDLQRKLEEAFDLELLQVAQARVRERVSAHTWEAFRLAVHEGVPVHEVAERVRLRPAMVHAVKSKVQRMLREEIAKLETNL